MSAAPVLLTFWKQDAPPREDWRIMQAVSALTGSTFDYNVHQWGSAANQRAIARFEAWIGEQK